MESKKKNIGKGRERERFVWLSTTTRVYEVRISTFNGLFLLTADFPAVHWVDVSMDDHLIRELSDNPDIMHKLFD